MSILKLSNEPPGNIVVRLYNDVIMGTFEVDTDGYYKFWPNKGEGFWEAEILLTLAEELRRLNKPWDDQVQAYFMGEDMQRNLLDKSGKV